MDLPRSASALPRTRATLAVGCFASICRNSLADVLLEFGRLCPDSPVGVHEMARSALLPALRSDEIALAILPGELDADTKLWSVEMWRDQVMVVMAPDHPLAGKTQIAPEQLGRSLFLVSREQHGGDLHRFLAQQIFTESAAPSIAMLDGDRTHMLQHVAAGDGLALVCASHLEPEDGRAVARPVQAAGSSFPVRAYWTDPMPQWPLSELIRLL